MRPASGSAMDFTTGPDLRKTCRPKLLSIAVALSARPDGWPDRPAAKHCRNAVFKRPTVDRHQPGHGIDGVPDRLRVMGGADHERRCQDPAFKELLQHEGTELLAG